ncbi:damage-control phosphatase ARMT1-like [Diorhabda carinulata]|uniref:damage-control phosphatase ARMT1-like n=1 Tax=Diorhabda carinulata TaxID=1163345 RepID=UPI0025A2CA75|nr:damage-control phosphatase ARMT1-like [Diorhabda carinulata]
MSDTDSNGSCQCGSNRSLDIKTPRNVHLSAIYKRSFAFYTVKHRMPVILTNLIDSLVRNKKYIIEKYGEAALEELKIIIGEISELKYEIQTNKSLKPLTTDAKDVKIYNDYIYKQTAAEGHTTHFHTIWLLTECYMYRRIKQMFETKTIIKDYDYFLHQKQEAYTVALPIIKTLAEFIVKILTNQNPPEKNEFVQLLKVNLWGNKCDLSLSLGKANDSSQLFDTAALNKYILYDDSETIWENISNDDCSDIIDIVFDNSGYEVFTDLCVADYLITKDLAKSMRLYVKTIQWFISDVMQQDFFWILDQLKSSNNEYLRLLGGRWSGYIENGTWTLVISDFWTLPFDFTHMSTVEPELYKQLAQAKAVFFKGDLNYRKLFGEKNWDPATPVDEALQGFHPTKLCIIRTIKADIVCGLPNGLAEEIEAEDEKWMEKGDYGLIQFSKQKLAIE